MFTVFFKKSLSIKSVCTVSEDEALKVLETKKTCVIVQNKKIYERKGEWGGNLSSLLGQAFDENKLDLPKGNRYCVIYHAFGRRKFISNNHEIAKRYYCRLRDDKGNQYSKVLIHDGKVLRRDGWKSNRQRSLIGEMFNMKPEEYHFDSSKIWSVYYKNGFSNSCIDKNTLEEALEVFNTKSPAILCNSNVVLERRGAWDYYLASLHGQAFDEKKLLLPKIERYFVLWYLWGRKKAIFDTLDEAEYRYLNITPEFLISKWLVYDGKVLRRKGPMNNKQRAALGELFNLSEEEMKKPMMKQKGIQEGDYILIDKKKRNKNQQQINKDDIKRDFVETINSNNNNNMIEEEEEEIIEASVFPSAPEFEYQPPPQQLQNYLPPVVDLKNDDVNNDAYPY